MLKLQQWCKHFYCHTNWAKCVSDLNKEFDILVENMNDKNDSTYKDGWLLFQLSYVHVCFWHSSGIPDPNPVSGIGDVSQRIPVNERVDDLEPEEEYTFRVQAENDFEDDDLRFSAWEKVEDSTLGELQVNL